ncbi:hypothetical protein DAEQUDRAFT_761105 [Daedalea quercina L-15889]|uniref:Uncharacterized protein n=1 Tax=Daedalea quercina L-15889 TaxID=1314783 RepID=A0A165UMU8_9APHY|nr:hypothetical protein DAEQUDRAFT_761105 [Daedalea quercina L-15889]
MNSPDILSREDYLRQLLDQRAARADLPSHGRFPSLSEFSDSPSVYSRPYFSPRPNGPPVETGLGTYEIVLPPRGASSAPRSPMSDRERLNLPNASSLDLDDDSQCSYDHPSRDADTSPATSEEELPRISTYGPKMTVHSRAPWELSDDDTSDHEEPTSSGSGKKRSGNKRDGGKRVWGLGKSSGDRQSDKRPSTDSNRSQSKPKPSMESFTGNGGALLALAQASMSSTSLAMNSPQSTLRDKLSLSRLRPRTPSNAHPIAPDFINARPTPLSTQSSSNASPMTRYVHTASPTPVSPVEQSFDQPSSRSPTPSSHGEYTHPYANPDLVRRTYDKPKSVASPKASIPPLPSPTSIVNRSDSNATLTESTASSGVFQSRSNTTTSSLTPVTSLSSVEAGPKDLSPLYARGKGISGPVLVNKPSFSSLSVMNGVGAGAQTAASPRMRTNDVKQGNNPAFMGFGESPAGSSIKLISLEQAQAQARERSRSATANPAISSNYTTPRSETTTTDQDVEGQSSSSRTRSVSTGGKTRSEPGPRPPMPGPTSSSGSIPQKTVARKKSGFMRLFNGKERERGLYSPPPPVPPLASDVASVSSQAAGPRQRKGSAHRVPVPSLSPSLVDREASTAAGGSGGSSDSHNSSPTTGESSASRERQLSARRNVPGLSINTSAHMSSKLSAPQTALSEKSSSHGHTITVTPTASDSFTSGTTGILPPSSAPPTSSDFVGLSLRPVSTLFSNNSLGESLVSPGAMDSDTGTPTTAATAISPLSTEFPLQLKGYTEPAEDGKSAPLISQDDQSSIVEAMQEQVLAARRAWQRQIWELEGQVRDLKAEVEELRTTENTAPYCSACGRGNVGRPTDGNNSCVDDLKRVGVKIGVVNRPRARTGVGSRFASGT